MAGQEPRVLRFGNFELDQQTCELRKHGLKIKLQHKPFQVLKILLQHSGEIVTREQLRQSLWPDGVFVDFDHSLNAAINKLRDALGDTAAAPRYIATIDRHGYRFSSPVIQVPPAEKPISQQNRAIALGTVEAVAPPVSRPWHRSSITLAMFFAALIVAAWASLLWFHQRPRARSSTQKMMLAVLPFENLTGDASQDYFSDGLTEEMIAQLGHLDPQHLSVIARTSVMHYKQTEERVDQIGRELGVQYVLEGSVRRDATNIRVTAQLIATSDQSRVWARQYDRRPDSFLAVQSEIAREVGDEIQLALGDGSDNRLAASVNRQVSASPSSYEAYDLYLKGRYFWNKRTTPGFRQSVEYFQQAIAIDPNYARAYAGLADAYALMSSYHVVAATEFMPKARAAALRALQIDETLAEAHTSLALISENYDWDWQTAEKEFRRAVQLDPAYATAHQWYAECLAFEGRFDEASAESERARQLDPLSLIIAADNGALLYFSRQYDRSIQQFRSVLDMEPMFLRGEVMLSAYVQKGDFAGAQSRVAEWRRRDHGPLPLAWEAYIYARSGELQLARQSLQKFERLRHRSELDPVPMLAVINAGMGNKDIAITWLEKGYKEHSNVVTGIKVDPIYDPLRSDPRFQDLERRVGLPP